MIQAGGLSVREAAMLRELDRRVGDLEDGLLALRQEFNAHREEYKEFGGVTNNRLDRLEKAIKEFASRKESASSPTLPICC